MFWKIEILSIDISRFVADCFHPFFVVCLLKNKLGSYCFCVEFIDHIGLLEVRMTGLNIFFTL
jgi:hypothetical protein